MPDNAEARGYVGLNPGPGNPLEKEMATHSSFNSQLRFQCMKIAHHSKYLLFPNIINSGPYTYWLCVWPIVGHTPTHPLHIPTTLIVGHRTGKGLFSFQSLRKAMPKNIQTIAQLHSSHILAKECSKFPQPGFNNMWTMNFQMFRLDLEKAKEPEIKLPTSVGS